MFRISLALAAALTALSVGVASASTRATTATKLVGTDGPGFTITLTKAGKKVRTLTPGKYAILIRDKSNIHNFHLTGPGVNKKTGVGFVGNRTWSVTLKKGNYKFVCDPHAAAMKGSFRVS
jgi:plastocyanin